MTHRHTHDHGSLPHSHSHEDGGHGHTHEIWENAGSYISREAPIEVGRDWQKRAFTVGIGGYTCRSRLCLPLGLLVLVLLFTSTIDRRKNGVDVGFVSDFVSQV